MAFAWDDSLSVGHPYIDAEHRCLIEILNRLDSAMAAGQGQDMVGITLCDLSEYCSHHFDTEEREMERWHYVDFDRHKRLHDGMIQRLSELVYRFESGQAGLTAETLQFLKDWLSQHIRIEDKRLVGILSMHRTL